MALEQPARPLSYDDYAAIDDDRRYQVLEGELVVTPSPNRRHQRLVLRLARALADFADASGTGEAFMAPFDVVLRAERPATVLQPDVMYVTRDRADVVTAANVQGAPDVVVEVLSPSNARLDTVRKYRLYASYGVREYWMVPLEFDRIEVVRLGEDGAFGRPALFLPGDMLTSPVLPGFELAIGPLFEALD